MSSLALVFRAVVGVLWWGFVGEVGGVFLSFLAWELALRLADFFSPARGNFMNECAF